jgi:glucan-binding YG repeat protein
MKKYKAFFDLELPDEFRVVKSRDRSSSDFLIVSAAVAAEAEKLAEKAAALAKQQEIRQKQAQLQAQQQAAQKKQSENKESKSQTEESTAPQSAKKETKHDYNTYNNIIKNSRKTFFFPDNFKNISDVAAGVISITPYEDKHIVKFQIQNKSSGYFFVANTALYKGSDFVICDYYNDSMVAGGRVLEGIIVAPQFKSRQKITFKLLESAGKNRVYEISINIP